MGKEPERVFPLQQSKDEHAHVLLQLRPPVYHLEGRANACWSATNESLPSFLQETTDIVHTRFHDAQQMRYDGLPNPQQFWRKRHEAVP